MSNTAAAAYKTVVETDVPMTTRDGVVLRADIYRPDAPERFPVLLTRLPYDKSMRALNTDVDFFVGHGYVLVRQDTRGRFASDGDPWTPLIWEAEDGYEAVEWAAQLPYSDGQVGTVGQSYLGATQYLLAPTRPPHLKAAFPVSASADFHESWVYHTGGAYELGWQLPYAVLMARDTIARAGLTDSLLPELEAALDEAPTPWAPPFSDAAYRRLPMMDWADALKPVAPYLADHLAHADDGPYWWQTNLTRQYRNIDIPMYHVSSWYDIFLQGGLLNFAGLRESAMTDHARANQKLLIGPWAHLFPYTSPTSRGSGDIDFGENALIKIQEIQLRWFDRWLKGVDNGIEAEAPIKIFVMGENVWRDENEWPLARTQYTPYYLHGGADGSDGDGGLRPDPPGDQPADEYTYDPDDPVPTCGGNTLIIAMGVQDQRPIETRPDVLVYTGAPLEAPLEVTGPVVVKLFCATSARDTDFTAKLVDVRPDGYAQNLTDGICRARYRNSRQHPELVSPGEVMELTIDLWATAHVFKPGHRIRVDISSSNFPRFDRNLNTGADQATGTRLELARQTVFHDQDRPSHILLPVIPR